MTWRVLFRTESGAMIGAGHLVRCLALAQQFARQGATVAFVCRSRPGALLDLPREAGFALHVLPETLDEAADAAATGSFARQWQANLAVVDHYRLAAPWEIAVREATGRLLAIDDLADRAHACDWLLDQNDNRPQAQRYSRWVPAACRLLLGPRFALLRPEFQAARHTCEPRDGQLRRLLVFFSGSDDDNETAKALRGLALLGPRAWRVDVVIGTSHPDAPGIGELCSQHGWHLHQQIDYMADLLAQADVCLGSAGTASWERCALGVPALVVELADNQKEVIAALAQRGCVKVLGPARLVRPHDYAQALLSLQPGEVAAMSRAAWDWVDGRGAERVARDVLETMSES
jgi:UDP-2,4-diacetamido-2,4,6-trideoxy-beta-L-altropyranose hydrolase